MLLPPPSLLQQIPPGDARFLVAPRASFEEAAARVLEAFDLGRALDPEVPLPPKSRASYRWLRACALAPAGRAPANPFVAGTPAHREAETLRAFLALPTTEAVRRLPTLRMKELGTHLALWRWGKGLSLRGEFTKMQRQAFEDRLLTEEGPALTQGYALRHALCFALAEKDEARLADMRTRVPEGQEPLYAGFQAAFGLLGGPMPPLRLWTLPGGASQDVALGANGTPVWMAPVFGRDLPGLPPGMDWVIPSATGGQDVRDPQLAEEMATEAQILESRLAASQRTARFAASRTPFETLGLVHFPILLRFDAKGNVVQILMGDAAPKTPGG